MNEYIKKLQELADRLATLPCCKMCKFSRFSNEYTTPGRCWYGKSNKVRKVDELAVCEKWQPKRGKNGARFRTK